MRILLFARGLTQRLGHHENILLLYYVKQIDSMLPLASSVIDHIRRQKVAVTSVTLGCTLCATFFFLAHYDVLCDILQNGCTVTWNPFV